jgi:hypothetical protein
LYPVQADTKGVENMDRAVTAALVRPGTQAMPGLSAPAFLSLLGLILVVLLI